MIEKTRSVEVSSGQQTGVLEKIGSVNRAEVHGDKFKLYTGGPSRMVKEVARIAEERDCPFCHAKRAVEFGEWLCSDILKEGTPQRPQ
ncbi:MAG: hypothetical protein ACQEP5_01465 [Actinomycetota bacterium]